MGTLSIGLLSTVHGGYGTLSIGVLSTVHGGYGTLSIGVLSTAHGGNLDRSHTYSLPTAAPPRFHQWIYTQSQIIII